MTWILTLLQNEVQLMIIEVKANGWMKITPLSTWTSATQAKHRIWWRSKWTWMVHQRFSTLRGLSKNWRMQMEETSMQIHITRHKESATVLADIVDWFRRTNLEEWVLITLATLAMSDLRRSNWRWPINKSKIWRWAKVRKALDPSKEGRPWVWDRTKCIWMLLLFENRTVKTNIRIMTHEFNSSHRANQFYR